MHDVWTWQEAAGLTDAAEVQKRVAEAQEAADFIRTNVVQAQLNERGNFGESLLLLGTLSLNEACMQSIVLSSVHECHICAWAHQPFCLLKLFCLERTARDASAVKQNI